MSVYSIKDLERYSGIKAHTLRIWEQRYNLLVPNRSATNIRFYSNADLRHILNVSFLNSQGIKISQIAKLSPGEIHRQVIEWTENKIAPSVQVESFITAMVDYDETKFERTFELCCKNLGFEKTMTEVVYPFLLKLGMLWQSGIANPGQEHFIANLIRQKLIAAIDKKGNLSHTSAPKILLFLPENEFHEIALLYYLYMLKEMGYKTYYLGQSVPFEDLEKAYAQIKPKFLLTIITCPKEEINTQAYIDNLSRKFKKSTVLLSGSATTLATLKIPKNSFLFKKPTEFTALLKGN